ncbi:hypothetical protein EN41_26820 [Agrobacterium tumefaciens]|jgi:hypothetical protein|nr:hypothetical protein EN41_26820 [Agrobacterium tumefaciens]WJK77814.1 hypothetical protein QOV31_004698 [Agrobacterium fabrum]KJX90492.1 hypothetical protein SY94_5080 [Agrobacterium tumefaciens]CAD0216792.1 hypothetical protein AGTUEHA105_LOCUS4721 [Agrobacterium tumefaciens]SDB70715.1 hypothetical protein SAMN03159422_03860 [Agrobacterium fabrum]
MCKLFGFVRKIFLQPIGARSAVMEMRQVFGPDATFSIMVPVDWLDESQTEKLVISAPRGV